MFWYLVICVLMVYPWCIRQGGRLSGKPTESLALGIACAMLWFFMAMRSLEVGVDTQVYAYAFTQFPDISFGELFATPVYGPSEGSWLLEFEPGYQLWNKLVSLFSSSPQAITVANSTVIMVLLFCLLRKSSPMLLLSVWMYLTMGTYQTQMNVARNAIAILMVYLGEDSLRERRFWRYALVCLLAATVHTTALVFLPLYWVYHYVRLTPRRCMLAVGLFLAVGVSFSVVGPYIAAWLPPELASYFEGDNEKLSSLLVGVLNAVIFFAAYLQLRAPERAAVWEEETFGLMMFTLNLCFFGLNIGLGSAARMAALFGAYMMLLIPRMLEHIRETRRRTLAVLLVAALCGGQYLMRLMVNNIGGTMPYRFFW